MGRFDPAGSAGRLFKAVRTTDWKGKATGAVQTLKDEFEAGKRGDDTPPEQIWASPKEQLDAIVGLLRAAPATDVPDDATLEADAAEVAEAVQGVDWAGVRAATAERTGDAAKAMKSMADQVDWAKVTPVASQMSSALIAAVAAGQLPVGGRLGATVARAIVDQGGLGRRVHEQVQAAPTAALPDFRGAIEATSRDT